MNAGPDERWMCYFWLIYGYISWLSVYRICARSACPSSLCRPCSHFVAPGWDRALRCGWAAALPHGHALEMMVCRIRHSHSKSSIHSLCSSGLDTGGRRERRRLWQHIYFLRCWSWIAWVQLACKGDTSGPQTSLKASLADCTITIFRKQI